MPTYEGWKWCAEPECEEIARFECSCGQIHPDGISGWANPPKEVADHPRFVCDKHYEKHAE